MLNVSLVKYDLVIFYYYSLKKQKKIHYENFNVCETLQKPETNHDDDC